MRVVAPPHKHDGRVQPGHYSLVIRFTHLSRFFIAHEQTRESLAGLRWQRSIELYLNAVGRPSEIAPVTSWHRTATSAGMPDATSTTEFSRSASRTTGTLLS